MERRLVQEARHYFYEQTELVFPVEWIEEFLADPLGQWDDAVPVENLAQRIVVRVDRRRVKGSEIAQYLGHLLKFTNVKSLKVEIHAKGKLNGEDYETQDTVRLMAKAVDELIDEFEDRVSIRKIRLEEGESDCTYEHSVGKPLDITCWWNEPDVEESWTAFEEGRASFQVLMQSQVAGWTNQIYNNDEIWDVWV